MLEVPYLNNLLIRHIIIFEDCTGFCSQIATGYRETKTYRYASLVYYTSFAAHRREQRLTLFFRRINSIVTLKREVYFTRA